MIGKVVVITGGASGIGHATAVAFAREGAKVVIGDIDVRGAEETVELISANGGAAISVRVDVTKSADVQQMITTAVDHMAAWTMRSIMPASSGRPPASSKRPRKIGNTPWRRT